MRIFVISNLYPPMHLGGYELGCADIVDGLRGRGHEVTVLTSRRGFEAPRVEGHVHRCLGFRPDQACGSRVAIFRRTWEDQRTLSRLAAAVKPDLLYAFSFYGISTALLLAAQRLGYPIAFAFSAEWLEPGFRGDSWLSFWHEEAGTPWKRVLKRFARRLMDPVLPMGLLPIDFHRAYFTSWRLRDLYCAKGFPVHDPEVIHWGVDLTRFHPPRQRVSA